MSTQDILIRFKQNQLRSEHILLAIIEDGENSAIEILKKLNVDLNALKHKTQDLVSEYSGTTMENKIAQLGMHLKKLRKNVIECKIRK